MLVVVTLHDAEADVTCYTCDVGGSGQCNTTSHLSEYCGHTDWCVKTWRGNDSDGEMSGTVSYCLGLVWALSTTQPFLEVKRPAGNTAMFSRVGCNL